MNKLVIEFEDQEDVVELSNILQLKLMEKEACEKLFEISLFSNNQKANEFNMEEFIKVYKNTYNSYNDLFLKIVKKILGEKLFNEVMANDYSMYIDYNLKQLHINEMISCARR